MKMHSNDVFNGLTMPVFTAFGWAGEENALKFAINQLELFISALYASLPREVQATFPYWGVDAEAKIAYISAEQEPNEGLFISFVARPLNMEVNLSAKEKTTLKKAYKAATSDLDSLFKMLADLGPSWQVHIQQVEFDVESGETTFYQDLLKSKLSELKIEETVHIIARAEYFNDEEKWLIPFQVFHRSESEKIAAMGYGVIEHLLGQINLLAPLAQFLSGKKRRPKKKATEKPKQKSIGDVEETAIRQPADSAELEKFVYVSHLLPLHIRRGFINLTPKHWPFFALNARTETREVDLKYGEAVDRDCTVWRLTPNDTARLVLSPKVQEWVDDNFDANDSIQISAVKSSSDEIEITLEPIPE
jgi:hypothetical protein